VKDWRLRNVNRWKPDLGELKKLVNAKTKLIYINHPNNPTGSLLTKGEMVELCSMASAYGSYVLSDEVYRGLEWETDDLSPAVVNFYERGISVSSLTKTLGATGIRFGWLATRDKQLYRDCFSIYYDTVLCHNIFAERVGGELLEASRFDRLLKEGKEVGRANLKALRGMVEKDDTWAMIPPGGAFTCFLQYKTREPSWDFCTRMLKVKPKGVYLVPGICYDDDCEHHVRVGLGVRQDVFKKAIELVGEGVKEYRDSF
jgi:aspartate/methionine/tyrosine aminotransferase